MESRPIKGRICYKDCCSTCGKDRGFVPKARLGLNCKSCSNVINKTGKSSPKKGVKTGKPAHNRGKYFKNKKKKTLRDRMSRRMRHALSNRDLSKKWIHIFDIVGYSVEELKLHIESKFENGMSWSNIGEWHIDHIIPESKFNYSDFKDKAFIECWSLDNLQPLWAKENLRKSDKILTGGGLSQKQ